MHDLFLIRNSLVLEQLNAWGGKVKYLVKLEISSCIKPKTQTKKLIEISKPLTTS